jgi:cellulose synthase/poly-beta-1,6-N-acetylglucosamine synthase-like glycosyltransferase
LVFLIGYFVLIKRIEFGWDSISSLNEHSNEKVSVVVAFRNEKETITSLVNQLLSQNINNDQLEIILVDDHSDDGSFQKLESTEGIILLRSDGQGKKAAINKGISISSGSIVLTTDADCVLHSDWVSSMVSPFNNEAISMVVGPVALTNEFNSFFGHLQIMEFASLIGSGAGAIAINRAFMCNGANLAFRKDVFKLTNSEIASGDDVFLMHEIKRNNGKIFFLKNTSAIVSTSAKQNISSFVNQRLRWSAKSTSYTDIDAIAISLLVFGANLSILLSVFMLEFRLALILLALKFLADFSFIKKLSYFFDIKRWRMYFLSLQLVYPFYIVYIAIVSQFKNYSWKGRILKK